MNQSYENSSHPIIKQLLVNNITSKFAICTFIQNVLYIFANVNPYKNTEHAL